MGIVVPSKEGHRTVAWMQGLKEVTIDSVTYRKVLVGATTHTFAGAVRFAGRTERCGDDESAALLHDVSRYGGGPVSMHSGRAAGSGFFA